MRHSKDAILSKLDSVRRESDGSAIADCPACYDKGKGKLKVFLDGSVVCYRFNGLGRGEHQKHLSEIFTALGLDEPVASAFISEVLFDGRLTIELCPVSRGRVRVVARNCNAVLARDELFIDRMVERAKFVGSLQTLTVDERKLVADVLIQLSDRFDRAQSAVEQEAIEESEAKYVSFAALEDGRIVEQVTRGFAVYNPTTHDISYCSEVEFEGITYRPLADDFIKNGGVGLPETVCEYGDEKSLDAEIESYIHRNLDLNTRDRKLSARYIRFSYLFDKTLELPYLRPLGPRGNGKSRFVTVVGGICYRPVTVISPSAASLFRIVDRYHPSLLIDEANFKEGSDDTQALIQILNSGYQKLAKIPRVEGSANGQFEVRLYDPYSPKLIASLKVADSQAFESRCIHIAMEVTSRKDIQLRLSARMLKEQDELRAKLTLWRLRNWGLNFESALDKAEEELKQFSIEPRYTQISIPLYALIDDSGLKQEFVEMLKGRDVADAEERRDSLDGQIVAAIHSLLFEIDDEVRVTLRIIDEVPVPEDGKPCELVPMTRVTEIINEDLPEKHKHDEKWIGRQIHKLNLRTQRVNRRASEYYKKRVLIFDPITLNRLFKLFSLPFPENFDGGNGGSAVNTNFVNNLDCPQENQTKSASEFDGGRLNDSKNNDLSDCPHCPQEKTGNPTESYFEAENSAISALVALDTETEPFDAKRNITHRNAKMIGLALCYDGQKADYYTDAASWSLMLPEPEQTIIFHNAKFDLGVLERAELELPKHWEDTLIAAHLLDENSEHGLKPLAKAVLGIEEPMTFNEADRMRLLDPQVFDEYARNDSRYTFRLWKEFEPRIDEEGLGQVYELEKSLVPIVRSMEQRGMKIDLSLIGTLQTEVVTECDLIEKEIYDHAGCKFDLHSPAKVAAILYDKLGVPSHKQTNGGKRSVDKESLKDVRGYHPAVDAILRYREVDKLASTFINVLPDFADENGRIHPEFKALGAKTGRFSCSDPNVQQMPSRSALGKRLRQAFVADRDNKLVIADYSQMELRVLAHYSQDSLLVKAYTSELETDLHTLTASQMFNKQLGEVSKQERGVAKMINFGIAYGITALGLFNRLRPEGHQVTQEDCERFIRDYFRAYSGVGRFLERASATIRQRGYVKNLYGRRRRLRGRTAREVRQAQNFIIQATAADITKQAMVELHNSLPTGAHLIAQVHDEFIVECCEADAERVRDRMVEVMTKAPDGFTIPLKIDAYIVNNWGDAK